MNETPCSGPIHPQALIGFALFDEQKYFEAHEALETAWREETGPIRDLYRGILQVAVAYYHWVNGNVVGTRKMFRRCKPWLARFPADCLGIDLPAFQRDYEAVETLALKATPGSALAIDRSLLKPIPWMSRRKVGFSLISKRVIPH